MKTTSLEISRKLKEIGFDAETNCFWNEETEEMQVWYQEPNREHFIKAFLLETILEALPKTITLKNWNYGFNIIYSNSSDCWIVGYTRGNFRETNFETYSEENESLADTAARLLILLVEKGIINLKE